MEYSIREKYKKMSLDVLCKFLSMIIRLIRRTGQCQPFYNAANEYCHAEGMA